MKKGEALSKISGVALVFVLLASTLGVLVWAGGSNAMVAGSVHASTEQPRAMIDSDTNVIALDVSAENEYEAGPIGEAESNSSLSSEIDASLNADKPVFLFFYADWCHFCQEQMPIVEEMELEYAEEIVVIYVNSDGNPQAMTEFGVTGFPTMFLISSKGSDGEYRYQEFNGFTDEETLGRSFDWVITYGSIPERSGADSDTRGEETIAAIAANFSQDLCIHALATEGCPDHCECLTDEDAEERELTLCDDELTECWYWDPVLGDEVMGHCYRTEEEEAETCPDHCECLTDEEAEERELTLCDDELTECTFYYPPLGIYVMGHCYRTDSVLTLSPAHPLPGERTTIKVWDMDESASDAAILYLDDRIVDVCERGDPDYCQLEFIFSDDAEIYIAVGTEYGQDISVFDRYGSPAIDVLADFYGDDDNDGVINGVDNCRDDKNADQADFDQDWVGDECDLCDPGLRHGITVTESWDFVDSDGCGHDDTDFAGPGYDGRIHYTQGRLRRQNEDTTFDCTARPCKDAVTTLATDSCDQNTLHEFYFVGNDGNYTHEEYHCWNGGCESGVCLCHDTDGGKNYGEKGSVGLYDDWCWADGSHLHEFWVEMVGDQCFRKSENHICDGSCQDGACVPATCNDGIRNQGETNIDCGPPCNISCDQVRITGRILYEEADVDLSTGATASQGFKPARNVVVKLYSAHSHPASSVAETRTNSDGYFSFVTTRHVGTEYHVRVKAENRAATVHKEFDGACNEYVFWEGKSDVQIPATGQVDFGDLEIGIDTDLDFEAWWYEKPPCAGIETDYHRYEPGGSVYFNIAESILTAREYVDDHERSGGWDDSIDKVKVGYPDEEWPNYSPTETEIELSGPFGFVDSTIIHEYGHHIEAELATWDNPDYIGGGHQMCGACGDSETAFSEGFANYLAYIVYHHHQDPSDPHFISSVRYRSVTELEDGCSDGGGRIEGNVMSALWDLVDQPGSSFPYSSNESWDDLSGLEDFILGVLDGEMDNWWNDAPDICEMRDCYGTRGTESLSDLDNILEALGIDCSGVSIGSCNGRE